MNGIACMLDALAAFVVKRVQYHRPQRVQYPCILWRSECRAKPDSAHTDVSSSNMLRMLLAVQEASRIVCARISHGPGAT
eukprot:6188522-Pleurochrysis_carterae.AAC.1